MGSVSLPGWGDIISVPKGPKPTKDQIKEFYRARRAGSEPQLPEDVTEEIKRRRNIRDKIQSSAAPDTSRAWTNVMTWLDDTQDLFSLVAFGGRLAARLMPKIMGRFIPGIGWVLLAADILKLLTMAAMIIQPFFVAMCHGWSKGVAGALPALMMGNAAKLKGHGIAGLNPFRRYAQQARIAKLGGRLFRVPELIEMAQAMKTITGYGLTLGGIMGTITESAYAIELATRGQPVEIRVDGGARVKLSGTDSTAYSPGSTNGLSGIYKIAATISSNPTDRAIAKSKADAYRQLGQ